jgi:hypothetical protein
MKRDISIAHDGALTHCDICNKKVDRIECHRSDHTDELRFVVFCHDATAKIRVPGIAAFALSLGEIMRHVQEQSNHIFRKLRANKLRGHSIDFVWIDELASIPPAPAPEPVKRLIPPLNLEQQP